MLLVLFERYFMVEYETRGKKRTGALGGPKGALFEARKGPQSGKIVEYDPSNEVFLLLSNWTFSFAVLISSF